jgi:sugar/nucleoside kinase (ribokinase family)
MTISVLHTGNFIVDQYVEVNDFPKAEQDTTARFGQKFLGAGFNSMKALALNNIKVTALSPLGNDANAEFARKSIAQYPIQAPVSKPGNQGYDLVFTRPDGEKAFCTFPGVESQLQVSDVQELNLPYSKFSALYFSGYSLLEPNLIEVHRYLIDQFVSANLQPQSSNANPKTSPLLIANPVTKPIIFLDVSPHIASLPTPALELIDTLFAYQPMISANQIEAEKFVNIFGVVPTITRLGSKGFDYANRVTAAEPVKVVDTSGAGDAFNGTFLAKLLQNLSPETAGQLANQYAAQIVGKFGPN